MLDKMNRYWRVANYLYIGQFYLLNNPPILKGGASFLRRVAA
jgi:phosphoketolase